MQSAGVDVWFDAAINYISIAALQKAVEIGWQPKQIYLTVLSSGINQLELVPKSISKGSIGAFVLKDPTDPEWHKDSAMLKYKRIMKKYAPGVDANDPTTLEDGYSCGVLTVQLLKTMKEPTWKGFISERAVWRLSI